MTITERLIGNIRALIFHCIKYQIFKKKTGADFAFVFFLIKTIFIHPGIIETLAWGYLRALSGGDDSS